MKRRTFIYLAAAAGLAVPFARCHHQTGSVSRTLSHPDFLGRICDIPTIREIGTVYRQRTPDEAHEDKLVSLLLGNTGGGRTKSLSPAEADRLPQKLDMAIREDYVAGKIVNIKGWILSLTEARQCALFSLPR